VRLEYLTIGWNSLEGLIAIVSGLVAGSIALVGFGLDSVIEVFSGTVLLWRLKSKAENAERTEQAAIRLVGASFILLAAYVAYESIITLLSHEAPRKSVVGIVLAAASMIVMPLLAGAKRVVARGLGSAAMHADSRQADFCAYLSGILLGGLLLNVLFRWWWADPVSALVMVPLIAKEGFAGLRGKTCCPGPSPCQTGVS
jgi:divalent metal cation (Fe/Co/Zn/Cd) transporter